MKPFTAKLSVQNEQITDNRTVSTGKLSVNISIYLREMEIV